MSRYPIDLTDICSKVTTYLSGSGTNVSVPTYAVFAEVMLIGGGGGGGGTTTNGSFGGGGGAGATNVYKFPVVTGKTYSYAVGGGGPGGAAGNNAGSPGVESTFTYNGTMFTANFGEGGGGSSGTGGTGGNGGAAESTTTLALYETVAGENGYAGSSATAIGCGGGIGGGLSEYASSSVNIINPGIANSGGGGAGSSLSTGVGGAGGSGFVQIIWYIDNTSNPQVDFNSVGSFTQVITTPNDTPLYIPTPSQATSARIILIGGGGQGGNYVSPTGGSGGGQGVISSVRLPIYGNTANELVQVKATTSNPWYYSTPTWELNAPATGNSVFWIWATPGARNFSPISINGFYVFYGNYNNTSASRTSAYLSFGVDTYGYVVLNGSVVANGSIAGVNGDFGFNGFSSVLVNLVQGNNTFQIYATSIDLYTYSAGNQGIAGTWLALTTATGGGGTVLYKTNNTWTWNPVYACQVGSGSSSGNGNDTTLTINTTYDGYSQTLNNNIIFTAGGGVAGVNASEVAVNSGTGKINKNGSSTTSTPSGTTRTVTTSGVVMYVGGSRGDAASGTSGGNGGSFTGGTGGLAPTAGQTYGGGGGGGGGSTTSTGANGGNGVAIITWYGVISQTTTVPLPVGLGDIAEQTNIYTSGTSQTVTVPSGTFLAKVLVIGPGGNGGAGGVGGNFGGGGGGGGSIGQWIIPINSFSGNSCTYTVGTPGTNTTFTINSLNLIGNRGGNGGTGSGGAAGTGGSKPSVSVPDSAVVLSIAGDTANAGSGATGGTGGGINGGAATSIGGYGGGGGGGNGSGTTTGGSGGNGLIVVTWYYYQNIPPTKYTSYIQQLIVTTTGSAQTVTPPTNTKSFFAIIIGGGGSGSSTFSSGTGGGGGSGAVYTTDVIVYTGGDIIINVGARGVRQAAAANATGYKTGGATASNLQGIISGAGGGASSLTYNSITYFAAGGNGADAQNASAGQGGACSVDANNNPKDGVNGISVRTSTFTNKGGLNGGIAGTDIPPRSDDVGVAGFKLGGNSTNNATPVGGITPSTLYNNTANYGKGGVVGAASVANGTNGAVIIYYIIQN